MMTLEEAIEHCEQKACDNSECPKEHKQLAEWLKELQALRRNSNTETIRERAEEYNKRYFSRNDDTFQTLAKVAYIAGATEQKAIDIEKVCDWLSNYFVFEHEAMSAAGCDAFLRKLRKDLEE